MGLPPALGRWLERRGRLLAGAGLVFVAAAAYHFVTEFRNEPMLAWDGYVHTKIAHLYWTGECPVFGNDFPWMRFTFYNSNRHDWELLYHLVLIPFTALGLITGGKLSAVLFASLLLAVAYAVMRANGVRWAWAFCAVLLLASPALVWRWHLARPTTLVMALLLLVVHYLARKRAGPVLVLSLACMWLYNLPQSLIVLGGVGFLVHTVLDRRPPWRVTGALALGLALGVVLHPGFWTWDGSWVETPLGLALPQNGTLQLWREVQQIVEVAANDGVLELEGDAVRMALPGELRAVDTQVLLQETGLTLALVLGTVVALVLVPRRIPRVGLICLGLSAVFLYLMLTAIRFLEYWVPFTVLACAFALRDTLGELPHPRRWAGRVREALRGPAAAASAVGLLVAVAATVGAASLVARNLRLAQEFLDQPSSRFGAVYESAMRWLERDSQPGDLVFHTDWDDFGPMFFYNHKNHYMVGFLPNFFSMHDPQKFKLWQRVGRGELDPASTADAIRSFGARYVLITHQPEWEPAFESIWRAPGLEWAYRDEMVSVFRVGPP